MLENKRRDMTPFDLARRPVRQNPFLLPFIWGASYLMTRRFRLKISKDLRGVKPPYLVISTHQGFSDYYIAPLACFPHRANYVSDMEGFAAFGEWLYRQVGCIGKRRYVPDVSVVRNMKYCLERGDSVVLFPESRHSNVGTTSYISGNLGKLAKVMGVPVVTLAVHGSYLANPFWDEEHTRIVPMEARMECVYTKEELQNASGEQIQKRLYQALQYDEYAWQKARGIKITKPGRAEGLHKALYKCRCCMDEESMATYKDMLICKKCGTSWKMTEYGELQGKRAVLRISDWYEWQRREAVCEWREIKKPLCFSVRVEALPNAKGFVPLGEGRLTLDEDAFTLKIKEKRVVFLHHVRESVQTEYDYRKRGECIVLSTTDCCYYLYPSKHNPSDKAFHATWIQFVGEYCHWSMQKEKS